MRNTNHSIQVYHYSYLLYYLIKTNPMLFISHTHIHTRITIKMTAHNPNFKTYDPYPKT